MFSCTYFDSFCSTLTRKVHLHVQPNLEYEPIRKRCTYLFESLHGPVLVAHPAAQHPQQLAQMLPLLLAQLTPALDAANIRLQELQWPDECPFIITADLGLSGYFR